VHKEEDTSSLEMFMILLDWLGLQCRREISKQILTSQIHINCNDIHISIY